VTGATTVAAEAARMLTLVLPAAVELDAPLGPLTTYQVGGRAPALVRAATLADLAAVAGVVRETGVAVLVVGRGSNLLVADAGFQGIAVQLVGDFEAVELATPAGDHVGAPGVVRAGGAVALPVLARRAAGAGLAGLEFYVGIPGTVGGAVRMNAGGHGTETGAVLHDAEVVDLAGPGRPVRLTPDRFDLGYRRSNVGPREVVVGARFRALVDDPAACADRIAEIVRWRREHQPGGANAGSVFSNPPGDAAGRIIDACGLKGLRVGGAAVSTKHANFIQADPGARAGDVAALVAEVRRRVAEEAGVDLHPELCLVGFDTAGAGAAT
jgi:UDP-N-acetylmuramate dehydrogenase